VGAGPLDQQLKPVGHVGGLQQLQLLLERQVRGVPGGVGQRRRVLDLLDRVDDLEGAAVLQDLDRDLAVGLGQLTRAAGDRGLGTDLGLDPEREARAGRSATDLGAPGAADHGHGLSAAQPADLLDHGQGAVGGVLPVRAWHQQQFRMFARVRVKARGVDRGPYVLLVQVQGHDHARQHDLVIERQHGQSLGGGRDRHGACSLGSTAGLFPAVKLSLLCSTLRPRRLFP
jgi:hypothetical protein